MKNEQYLRLWLEVILLDVPDVHKQLMEELIMRASYEDRLPDEDSLHFIFSFFGS